MFSWNGPEQNNCLFVAWYLKFNENRNGKWFADLKQENVWKIWKLQTEVTENESEQKFWELTVWAWTKRQENSLKLKFAIWKNIWFSNMVNKCCVPNCKSGYVYKDASNAPPPSPINLSFHSFPIDPGVRQNWITAIPRAD